jgi:hypothetical protein
MRSELAGDEQLIAVFGAGEYVARAFVLIGWDYAAEFVDSAEEAVSPANVGDQRPEPASLAPIAVAQASHRVPAAMPRAPPSSC